VTNKRFIRTNPYLQPGDALSSQTPDTWPTTEDTVIVTRRDTRVAAPPPEAGPPPPDRRIGAGMLLALGAIALVAAGALIAWLLTHTPSDARTTTVLVTTNGGSGSGILPPKVSVPRVVGLKADGALVALAKVGLKPKQVFKPTKEAKGVVVSQAPREATAVVRGSRVTLVIDAGAPQLTMPNVTGTSYTAALARLDQLGLVGARTDVSSSEPPGTVVEQTPTAGKRIAKGSTVTLSVAKPKPQSTQTTPSSTTPSSTTPSSTTPSTTAPTTSSTTTASAPAQPQNASIPDVSGQKEAAAITALGKAGILASLVFVPNADPLGTVVQQAKQAGTTVPYHSHVQLNLSRGPNNNALATVPSVIGRTLEEAVDTLNGAHLRLIFLKLPVSSRAQAGKIVQQSPLGGGEAPENAQVVVYLGAFSS
jgi:beta-lactam-binding protein with PASTA domain